MFTRKHLMIALSLLFVLLLAACNMPNSGAGTPQDLGAIHTAAAQTVVAQLTSQAPTATPGDVVINDPDEQGGGQGPTATAGPTDTSAPSTNTPQPSVTPLPSSTPQPTNTSVPTATPIPCYMAQFVRDVQVEDGETFTPGARFTKVWRLKNVGSCTWSRNTVLVFVRGDDMGDDNIPLPHSVPPGDTVDAEVDLVAPSEPGTYTGYWMLRDGGVRFGLGQNADKPFWVEIKVVRPARGEVYNFATNACSADWESGAGELDCPGRGTEPAGFVLRLNEARLEHRRENEPILWTNPQMISDGWITGTYPGIRINSGDRFLAEIGCVADYDDCDVTFRLNYRVDDLNMHTLGEWHEVYDGQVTFIDIDLSSLAGQNVEFILTVFTNGSSRDDAAFWLNPHIRR